MRSPFKKQLHLQGNSLGQQSEQKAAKFLQSKGYVLLARNYSTPFGEVDLIFRDGSQVVFVEVKARASDFLGRPEEAVTKWKLTKISKVADFFMANNPKLPQSGRIEVIAIIGEEFTHYTDL